MVARVAYSRDRHTPKERATFVKRFDVSRDHMVVLRATRVAYLLRKRKCNGERNGKAGGGEGGGGRGAGGGGDGDERRGAGWSEDVK